MYKRQQFIELAVLRIVAEAHAVDVVLFHQVVKQKNRTYVGIPTNLKKTRKGDRTSKRTLRISERTVVTWHA